MGTERIGGRYSRPELSSHLRKQTHIFLYIPIARGIWKISVPSQDFCECQTALKVTEVCARTKPSTLQRRTTKLSAQTCKIHNAH